MSTSSAENASQASEPASGAGDFFHNWNPLSFLEQVAVIACGALFLGLALPITATYLSGVFYRDTLAKNLPDDAQKKLKEFAEEKSKLRQKIRQIDDMLTASSQTPISQGKTAAAQEQLASLISLRAVYRNELRELTPPVVVKPLYLNPIMYLWPGLYLALGCLIVPLSPLQTRLNLRFLWRATPLAVGIYVMYEWPLWARNFLANNEGRRVYSYPNYDVSKASFFVQEFNILLFAILLAIVWKQWIAFFNHRKKELALITDEDACKAVFDRNVIERLSASFLQWQVAAVVLSAGFVLFTITVWDLIIGSKDYRYVFPAILAHVLWMISLVLLTLPLLITWYSWQTAKVDATSSIVHTVEKKVSDVSATLTAMRELQPIGFWNVAASSIAVLVAFVLPIVQAFYK